eukprot:CAMPEP_0197623268 /NCGR_PEP_ID=MMETSP1338-20131121/3314_1 /TAXON_ID=43686 ORGANISM="Pelagodinium beii, Strain RCC1491" /NCGR_SAMPLE_ID=MMETSP1338 /ASSEMBLY_ACC=CAM_ASM_000754 /LENGTH=213 /DNA_ID=CAMNT_0043193183 /DNA_START=523 /DNA_END=1161 /DNA_ORIENTATION=-
MTGAECTVKAQALLSPRYGNFKNEDSHTKSSPVLEELGAVYAICWQSEGEVIEATAAYGMHDFLKRSKSFTFRQGEGYVGKLSDAKIGEVVLIEDVLQEDPRLFHRKMDALINNIASIVFVRLPRATLEIGFEDRASATAASDSMRGDHFLRMQSRLNDFTRPEKEDSQADLSPVQILNAAKDFSMKRGRDQGSQSSSRDTTPSSGRRERLVW